MEYPNIPTNAKPFVIGLALGLAPLLLFAGAAMAGSGDNRYDFYVDASNATFPPRVFVLDTHTGTYTMNALSQGSSVTLSFVPGESARRVTLPVEGMLPEAE